jgi:serine/threonine-protein kinase HipA
VRWLDPDEVAARLREVRQDSGATRRPADVGQFSLAGAQPKTALLLHEGRWGLPEGRIPTSHILKPPAQREFDGYAENEHFCLMLAKRFGIPTCDSQVVRFDDEVAICVKRYDRAFVQDRWVRIHQEDTCQSLGVMPQRKYQNEGGPSPTQIAELIRQHSSRPAEDVPRFAIALMFNWLIGGPDAHAKNYSLLLGGGGETRLAPLYDLSSVLPYSHVQRQKLKLAMKIGSHYHWSRVRRQDWVTLARELKIDPTVVGGTLTIMASTIADEAATVARQMTAQGLDHPVVQRLVDAVATSAQFCQQRLLQK